MQREDYTNLDKFLTVLMWELNTRSRMGGRNEEVKKDQFIPNLSLPKWQKTISSLRIIWASDFISIPWYALFWHLVYTLMFPDFPKSRSQNLHRIWGSYSAFFFKLLVLKYLLCFCFSLSLYISITYGLSTTEHAIWPTNWSPHPYARVYSFPKHLFAFVDTGYVSEWVVYDILDV